MSVDHLTDLRTGSRLPKNAYMDNDRKGRDEFLDDYFKWAEQVNVGLLEMRGNVKFLGMLRAQNASSTSTSKDKQISQQLLELLQSTSALAMQLKGEITKMRDANVALVQDKQKAQQISNTQVKIRVNVQITFASRLRSLIGEMQEAEAEYKAQTQNKTARQLAIVFPDATSEEVHEMAMGDMDTSQVIQQKMQGTHVTVQDALQGIQSKYNDVRRIEESVQELHEMFTEMALLVRFKIEMFLSGMSQLVLAISDFDFHNVFWIQIYDSFLKIENVFKVEEQGQVIDIIDMHIDETLTTQEQATNEMRKTRKHQKSAGKCWCCTIFHHHIGQKWFLFFAI